MERVQARVAAERARVQVAAVVRARVRVEVVRVVVADAVDNRA